MLISNLPGAGNSVIQGGQVRKPRLAIVSTFDDLCGIAGYTRFLEKQLGPIFNIEVFDLDQLCMRSLNRRIRKVADKQIRDICVKLNDFDYLNIQFEPGTIGTHRRDILRRFTWLVKAAPAGLVTFHTIVVREKLDFAGILRSCAKLDINTVRMIIGEYRTGKVLSSRIYNFLRSQQRKKRISIIVHNRRDMRILRYAWSLNHVYDHPLVFLSSAQAAEARANANRSDFPLIASVPPEAKLIGTFGFISPYKGHDTVIRAMHLLPDDYHLLIFGGIHPNEIKCKIAIDPYVQRLLETAYADENVIDPLLKRSASNPSVSLSLDASTLVNHPKDISKRIHFMGAQTDEQFVRSMTICDAIVLAYLEVGQSSSGVLSLATDLGCRVLAARNLAFLQFARYHPKALEFFEIGNFVELAARLKAAPEFPPERRMGNYNYETSRATYFDALLST